MEVIREQIFIWKKSNNYLSITRDFIAILIILWSINPQMVYYNKYIWGILFLYFLVVSFFTDTKLCLELLFRKEKLVFIYLWPATLFVFYLLKKNSLPFAEVAYITLVLIFWYYYKKKDFKFIKLVLVLVGVYLLQMLIVTSIDLIFNPDISRNLAFGSSDKINLRATAYLINLNLAYTFVLIAISVLGSILNEKKHRFTKLSFLMLAIITIIRTKYRIAILVLILFSLFYLFLYILKKFFSNRTILFIIFSLILIVLLVVLYFYFQTAYLDGFKYYYQTGRGFESSSFAARFEVYERSINTFLENPIFGVGVSNKKGIGNHSTIFDGLAKFGFIGFITFIFSIFYMFVVTYKIIRVKYKTLYLVVFLSYIMILILNPAFVSSFIVYLYIILPWYMVVKND